MKKSVLTFIIILAFGFTTLVGCGIFGGKTEETHSRDTEIQGTVDVSSVESGEDTEETTTESESETEATKESETESLKESESPVTRTTEREPSSETAGRPSESEAEPSQEGGSDPAPSSEEPTHTDPTHPEPTKHSEEPTETEPTTESATPEPSTTEEDSEEAEARRQAMRVITLTNTIRAQHGLPALQYDPTTQAVADLRAAEQLKAYGHVRPDGTECWTAYNGAHFFRGENVAMNYSPFADYVMLQWMNSQGHKDNILGNFKYISVGIARRGLQYYWVQCFFD